MKDFIKKIVDAHGGITRWLELSRVDFNIVSGGKLFDLQGQPQDSNPRTMDISLHQQKASLKPYGGPGKQTNFNPEHIAIETVDGEVLSERRGTIGELHNHMKSNGWDGLDRAYFNGYALWTYLCTPFFMTLPGIKLEEIAQWQEGDEFWRGIRVYFPGEIATHSRVQDFYFGDDFYLRRHDYFIDVAGNFFATQYVFNYKQVDGIYLPTKRMAYKKAPDGTPIKEDLMVHIDFSEISYS